MTRDNKQKNEKVFSGIPLNYEKDFWMCPRVFDEYWGELNQSECKLLLCVLRKIIGWDKKRKQGWDFISESQFRKYTGLSKNSVKNGVKSLVEKGFVRIGEETRHDGTLKFELVMFDGLDDEESNFDKENQILTKEGSNFERDESKSIQTINTNNKDLNIEKYIEQIFSYYKKRINEHAELTKIARKRIKDRLAEFDCNGRYLGKAILCFSENSWCMENQRGCNPEWFFKDKNQIAKFLNLKRDLKPYKEKINHIKK